MISSTNLFPNSTSYGLNINVTSGGHFPLKPSIAALSSSPFRSEKKHDAQWLQKERIDSDGDLETDPDEWKLFPYINNTTAYEYARS